MPSTSATSRAATATKASTGTQPGRPSAAGTTYRGVVHLSSDEMPGQAASLATVVR